VQAVSVAPAGYNVPAVNGSMRGEFRRSAAGSAASPESRRGRSSSEHPLALRTSMPNRSHLASLVAFSVVLLPLVFGSGPSSSAEEPADAARPAKPTGEAPKWVPLFDGKTLEGWKESDFGGGGDVKVEDGKLVLGIGTDLTGVTVSRETPKINYEVELETMRVEGSDFFCGLTFPVKDRFCSLILGGWGGGVVGLSSLNGFDASENETSTYKKFENGKWYAVRLRVTANRITAWLDGEEIVDTDIRDVKLTTRIEVESSKPFGISTWRTKAALRKIRVRDLTPEEVKTADEKPVDE